MALIHKDVAEGSDGPSSINKVGVRVICQYFGAVGVDRAGYVRGKHFMFYMILSFEKQRSILFGIFWEI